MSAVLGGFDIETPTDIITGEPVLTSTGQLGSGSYMYKFTYMTNFGETLVSPASAFIASANSIFLTLIPPSTNIEVLTKRIYRTTVNGSTFKYLTSIPNSQLTYLDTSPDGALTGSVPTANWASSAQVCSGWTEFSKPIVYSVANLTAAGSTADTATLLEVENAFVSVPMDLNGIILPVIKGNLIGQKFIINNVSASNSLRIYPALPDEQVGGGGPGVPYVLGPLGVASLISSGNIQWTSASSPSVTLPPSLVSLGNLVTSGNEIAYTVATNTWALSSISPAGRSFLTEGNQAAQRAAIGTVIGVDVQAYSANLATLNTIGNLPANNMIYTTGTGFSNSIISPYARSCLAQTTSAGFRSALGLTYLPADTNGGFNLSADIVVGCDAAQTITNKTITAANTLTLGAGTSFNGLAFQTVASPNAGDVLAVVGGKLALLTLPTADVTGPAGATDNTIALFNGATGKIIKASTVSIAGGVVSGVGTLNATSVVAGSVSATTVSATTLTGTLSTGAQTAITSVGTLSSLDVTGTATVGGVVTFNGGGFVSTGQVLAISDAPSAATSAVNKAYVDSVIVPGAVPLVAANGATVGVLPNTPVYVAAAGTLTATGAILILIIDGITYSVSDGARLLVKDQADPRQNGVYTRGANSGGNWQLVRTTDFNMPSEAIQNTSILVLGGTININTSWALRQTVTQFSPSLATPGTSDVLWTQIAASQNLTTGSGLTRTGNVLSVVGTTNRITVGVGVDIASNYVGQTTITTLGSVATGTWNATTITAQRGGTGVTSPTLNNILVTNGASAMTLKANPTGAFVGTTDVQTVTNKIVSTGRINTAGVVFANTDVTAATLTLNTAGLTAARTITVPDATDTLALVATAQTLTAKTITDNTSNILARGLWNATGANSVSTYAAANPTTGQVLTATSASTATWQTLSAPSSTFSPARTIFVYQGAPGVAPNYASFTAAIAYAQTLTLTIANQALICVYPGVYTEVNPIAVPQFVTVTSMTSSQSSVLLRPASPAAAQPMLTTTGNARLMGFIVSCRDPGGLYATIGISSSGSAGAIDLFTFMTVRNCSQSCYQVTGSGTVRSHIVVTKGCTAQNTIAGTTITNGFECLAGGSFGGTDTIITGVYTAGIIGEITNGIYAYNDTTIADIQVLHVTYCTNALRVGGGTVSNSQTEYPLLRLGAAFLSNISAAGLIMDEKSTCVLGDVKVDDSSGFFPNQRHLIINNPALPAEPNLLMMASVVARSDKITFGGATNNPPRMIGYGISDIPGEAQNRFQGEVTVGSPIAPCEFSAGEGDANTMGLATFLNSGASFTNVTAALGSPSRDPIAVDAATVAAINLASAPSSIDGVTPVSGITRVLVMFGSTTNPGAVSVDNGIYIWNGTGAAMTRSSDFAAASRRSHNTWFSVDSGTVNYGSVWKIAEATLVGTDTVIVGTTAWGVRAQSSKVFPSLTNGDALYIGNVLLRFPGVLLSVVKPITLSSSVTTQALVWEFWNGSAWVTMRFMAAMADIPYNNRADSSFAVGLVTINPAVIRINYRFSEFSTWATTTINGVLAYWIRVREIDSSLISRIPTISRVKFHSNYSRIGTDGYNEYFGTARIRVDEKMAWNDTGASGETPNSQRVIFSTTPSVQSRQGVPNTFLSPSKQTVGMSWRPPMCLDSSANLIMKINGSIGNGSGGNLVFLVNYVFVKDGDVFPDTTGIATAVGRNTVTQVFAAPNVVRGAFSTTISLDITGLNPNTDMVWLTFSRDGANVLDTCPADSYLHYIALSTLRWAPGDYMS